MSVDFKKKSENHYIPEAFTVLLRQSGAALRTFILILPTTVYQITSFTVVYRLGSALFVG